MGQQSTDSDISQNIYFDSLKNMQETRLKSLAKSKAFRDSVALWGEPSKLIRKRVMIAPYLTTIDGNYVVSTTIKQSINKKPVADKLGDEDKFRSYRNWIEQRKMLRKQFEKCVGEDKQKIIDVYSVASLVSDKSTEDDEEVNVKSYQPSIRPSISHPMPQRALGKIHQFLTEKRMRIYDLFVRADRDKDWKITRNEFQLVVNEVGIPITSIELEQLVLALDQNNDDVLEYKELVGGLNIFIKREKLQKSQPNNYDDNMQPEEEEIVDYQLPSQNSSLLSLPDSSNTEFMANEEEEKRLKKQKRKEKHRNKMKSAVEVVEKQLCTMDGEIGPMVDNFQQRSHREYEKILELCHLHGVKLSRNLLERVLLHPEDRSLAVCISSLSSPGKHLPRGEQSFRRTANEAPRTPSLGNDSPKVIRRKSSLFSTVYPLAASVRPRRERMILSSGAADISRKTDCWMTFEEYTYLTRNIDSRYDKTWKPSDGTAYWPSYVSDKLRLYLDKPGKTARSENSIFEIVHNQTIH